ncbi:MAG: hypothetical protein RLZ98_297 [Pseudomonadota bacterium]
MLAIRHSIEESVTRIAAPLLALALCLAAVATAPRAAVAQNAQDLVVMYDQSQILRLPRAVSQIIIGNPTIADVAINSAQVLVVTGKSFGITNIIAIDANGHVIQDQRVLVQRDELKVVNLQKGGSRESYNCSPQCNPMITIGDDTKYFATVSKDAERKIKMSETFASGGGGGRQ